MISKTPSPRIRIVLSRLSWSIASVSLSVALAFAAPRFTEKQIEALGKYVGKTYWVAGKSERALFLEDPAPSAVSFPAPMKEAFQLMELLHGAKETLYYKVKFTSEKEAYLSVDTFLEELNSTVVTEDPDGAQKRKATQEVEEKNRRENWIRAQPWPQNIKEAALKRQAVLGMNMGEVKVALGNPVRIIKLKTVGRFAAKQEQWIYPGSILTFNNGVLALIQSTATNAE